MTLSISGSCKGTYTKDDNGIITPNYPSFYPNSKQCDWTIQVPEGSFIELKFQEFRLEVQSACEYYDWLQIYDGGSSSSSPLSEKLCGTTKPSNSISTGNKLFLQWESDGSGNDSGFKISASPSGTKGNLTFKKFRSEIIR